MNNWTRRQFLVRSGMAGAVPLVAGAIKPPNLHPRSGDSPLPPGAGVLVIVTLYGGNDGLNTVIPYADAAYYANRPGLAYQPNEVLRLSGSIGLNPGLAGLKTVWDSKQLAIVHGVGYPNPDHSHFRSMDIWQTASPDEPVRTGWIGRWLDATGDDPVRAVNIGSVLPPLAVGNRCTAASLPNGPLSPLWSQFSDGAARLSQPDASDGPAATMVCTSYQEDARVQSTFVGPTSGAASDGSLKNQLAIVGRCIKAGVPTRVYTVSMGGFDTHANEKAAQQRQLAVLDAALTPFLADMASDSRGRNVVTMVYSEFGRRVHANLSYGTDHGTAGPVLIAGAPVRGGFYGHQPSLTDLDNGDLKANVDFRGIYAELLAGVLNADPGLVLGADRPRLGLFAQRTLRWS